MVCISPSKADLSIPRVEYGWNNSQNTPASIQPSGEMRDSSVNTCSHSISGQHWCIVASAEESWIRCGILALSQCSIRSIFGNSSNVIGNSSSGLSGNGTCCGLRLISYTGISLTRCTFWRKSCIFSLRDDIGCYDEGNALGSFISFSWSFRAVSVIWELISLLFVKSSTASIGRF